MKTSSFVLGAAASLVLPLLANAQTQTYFTNTVNERAISCPLDPNQIGYKHITDIVVDQQSELDRIARGEAPRKPYIFPLCNNFKFLIEQEILQVLLDDIKFVCGYNGQNSELCVLEGGSDVQVDIPAGAANRNIEFEGITFVGFSGVSTKAYGDSTTTVTFKDCSWQDFHSGATAVHQLLPQGGIPNSVVVDTATFRNGTGANLFENNGGTLTFNNMDIIESVRVDSMIRTSSGGTSTLNNVKAKFSDLTKLTHTLGGATQNVNNVEIEEMNSLGSILFVEGSGSFLKADGINLKEIHLLAAYDAETSRNFNLLIATDSSRAVISNVEMMDCDGVDRIFSANDGATVDVTDVNIERVEGTQPPDLTSNIAMAEDGGSMNVLRLKARDVTYFGAAWFAICGSFIQVKQSCVFSGEMAAPAFIGADCTFDSAGNYMDVVNLNVARCINNAAASVYTESAGAQCFSNTGTGACSGTCAAGFTESSTCIADSGNVHSLAPQAAPGGSQGNQACPASPPTPMPTLPPGFLTPQGLPAVGGSQEGGSENQPFTATLPPNQQGGGGGGSDPNGSSNSGTGGSDFNGGGGGGSSAFSFASLQWSQFLQVGAALVAALQL